MQKKVDRREFLIFTGLLAGTAIVACNSSTKVDESIKKEPAAKGAQNFIAGFAPLAGMQSTEEMFWQACDACARLGFHYLDWDSTI